MITEGEVKINEIHRMLMLNLSMSLSPVSLVKVDTAGADKIQKLTSYSYPGAAIRQKVIRGAIDHGRRINQPLSHVICILVLSVVQSVKRFDISK